MSWPKRLYARVDEPLYTLDLDFTAWKKQVLWETERALGAPDQRPIVSQVLLAYSTHIEAAAEWASGQPGVQLSRVRLALKEARSRFGS
jgi:hypothetical protein